VTQGFIGGGGGGRFPPSFPPPKPAMIFCKMMLWASKDRGETRIFKNGLKEELIS
jgi:hypothetical protein